MSIRRTCATVVAMLTVAVPVAAAAPDGFQPQLQDSGVSAPDGYQPQLRTEPGSGGAAAHPDSRAIRPGVAAEAEATTGDGFSFSWGSGAVGAAGGLLVALLAIAGASAMRERRRLVLR